MPYSDKSKQKSYGHEWYLAHKSETYIRAREWKRKRREAKVNEIMNTPDTWFRTICEDICRGVSVKTHSMELQDKFWDILMSKVGKVAESASRKGTQYGQYTYRERKALVNVNPNLSDSHSQPPEDIDREVGGNGSAGWADDVGDDALCSIVAGEGVG